jgi:hypothetical protein
MAMTTSVSEVLAVTAPLPALPTEASQWDQALYAFLVEKGNRSGSKRTVESYSRMLWRFFADTTPDRVRSADVLSYAHGIGLSGKPPSPVTIGARIACLSSYFKFLQRMGLLSSNPCDLVERPKASPSPARGYSADGLALRARPSIGGGVPQADAVGERPSRALRARGGGALASRQATCVDGTGTGRLMAPALPPRYNRVGAPPCCF